MICPHNHGALKDDFILFVLLRFLVCKILRAATMQYQYHGEAMVTGNIKSQAKHTAICRHTYISPANETAARHAKNICARQRRRWQWSSKYDQECNLWRCISVMHGYPRGEREMGRGKWAGVRRSHCRHVSTLSGVKADRVCCVAHKRCVPGMNYNHQQSTVPDTRCIPVVIMRSSWGPTQHGW